MTESCSGSSSTTDTFLGIDVSTSCTGFSLVDSSGRLLKASFVYLSDLDTMQKKGKAVENEMLKYLSMGVKRIGIEQNLLGFRRGASSANTLITLARFNGVVHYIASCVFGVDPVTIPVVPARKGLGIVYNKGENVKEKVFEWVVKQEPDYVWPTKEITRGKLKGQTVKEKGVEDAADAYVMARAVLSIELDDGVVTINRDRRRRKSSVPRKSVR